MPTSLRFVSTLGLIATTAAAQVPFDRFVVATRLPGPTPVARLLAISAQGTITPFSGFPSDGLVPLAVEIDPLDGHVLVALDLGTGASLVVKLVVAGTAIVSEQPIALVPGPVTQLGVVGDTVFASVGGSGGGLFRMPRRSNPLATATVVVAQPSLDAMFLFGQQPAGILAWSFSAAQSGGLGYYDFALGQPLYGPFSFGLVTSAVTGVTDVPTGLPRQLLSFADGTIATFAGFLGPPAPILLVPQPPPGGAVALKSPGPSFFCVGLGGAAFPFLYDVDPNAGTTTTIAGPLAGDPVDFAMPIVHIAQAQTFGDPCGFTLAIGSSGGPPQLGNGSFRIDLGNGVPSQGALWVAGFSDVLAGSTPLPFALPGGCPVHVEPLALVFHVATVGGAASQPFGIPNQTALLGTFVFAQWLQVLGSNVVGSAGLSMQIGP